MNQTFEIEDEEWHRAVLDMWAAAHDEVAHDEPQ